MRTYSLSDVLPDGPREPREEPDHSTELDALVDKWKSEHAVHLFLDPKGSWLWEIIERADGGVYADENKGSQYHIAADSALVHFERYAREHAEEQLAYDLDPANQDHGHD